MKLRDQVMLKVQKTDQPVSTITDECSGNGKKYESMESSCCNSFQSSCQANGDLRSPKQKARPISGGTLSSMLGKGLMKSVIWLMVRIRDQTYESGLKGDANVFVLG
ncbi:hypothetical protein PVK06_025832 [Gossypium arboreum]|uniref:Uncharacterized protein n=1 Tax=Gossypium arboreum TaxID=29729 RepID=A0ABR0NX38_GOSAR|nr:hypothetical protein PVK06_025832 [Gossypium arboreum]